MKQLKMKLKELSLCSSTPLPEGVIIRTYAPELWHDLNNALVGINERLYNEEEMDSVILHHPEVSHDGVFIAYLDGAPVGTTTSCVNSDTKVGTVHMVSVTQAARGKKLGKILCERAIQYQLDHGCREIILTTDDFRLPAIKIYLDFGFVPVLWDDDMIERWSNILPIYGITEIEAYTEEGELTIVKAAVK